MEEIAEKVQCSEKTARRWVQKYEMGDANLFQDQRYFNMRQ
jgi:transposase